MKIAVQGYSTTQRFDMDTAYKMIKEAGFEAIDWALDQQWNDGKQQLCWNRASIQSGEAIYQDCVYDLDMDGIIAHYQPEIDTIKKYGLSITQAHAPFYSYSSKCAGFTDYAIETYKKVLKLCAYAGCPRLVIHGLSKQVAETVLTDGDIHDENMKIYKALIPTAIETGVMVLLENLFVFDPVNRREYEGTCSNAYDAISYIDTLNEIAGRECFGLCFDTGHINLVNKYITEYVEKLGHRIKALHIHDNNGLSDLHLSPYTGMVNWKEFYSSLKNIGYTGDLSFETFKQVCTQRCDNELVLPSLKLICDIGKFFRSKIM